MNLVRRKTLFRDPLKTGNIRHDTPLIRRYVIYTFNLVTTVSDVIYSSSIWDRNCCWLVVVVRLEASPWVILFRQSLYRREVWDVKGWFDVPHSHGGGEGSPVCPFRSSRPNNRISIFRCTTFSTFYLEFGVFTPSFLSQEENPSPTFEVCLLRVREEVGPHLEDSGVNVFLGT